LSDGTKFEPIAQDQTKQLKSDVNKLIDTNNSVIGDVKLQKITGEFEPGYIYGNVKIHKENNFLRPIISQIPTPTYKLAKKLNELIVPNMPVNYTLKSSEDFVRMLQSIKPKGELDSLDVESLFTNVPIEETIKIIQDSVFNHPTLTPLRMSPMILRELLLSCTTKAPFRTPEGKLYRQTNGIAMGSPLGPTFANFYVGDLELRVLNNNPDLKPQMYGRYVDDIFLVINDEEHIKALRSKLEEGSKLGF